MKRRARSRCLTAPYPSACVAAATEDGVLELAYGPAPVPTTDDVPVPDAVADVRALGWRELQVVAARLLGELPTTERADLTMASLAPVSVTDDSSANVE